MDTIKKIVFVLALAIAAGAFVGVQADDGFAPLQGGGGTGGGGSGGGGSGSGSKVSAYIVNGTTQSITGSNAIYAQSGATTSWNYGMTVGAADTSITVSVAGIYLIDVALHFAQDNTTYRQPILYVNGLVNNSSTIRPVDAATTFTHCEFQANLAANDKVQVGASSGVTINLTHVELGVSLIGNSGGGGGGGGSGGVTVVGAEIHHTAAITLTSGVGATVAGYASTTRNTSCTVSLVNGSITVPTTGTYIGSSMIHWQDDGDIVLQNAQFFEVNGSTVSYGFAIPNTCTGHGSNTRATQPLSLVAGDVVKVRVIAYTNGGGTHLLDTVDFSLDLIGGGGSGGGGFTGGNISSTLAFQNGPFSFSNPQFLAPPVAGPAGVIYTSYGGGTYRADGWRASNIADPPAGPNHFATPFAACDFNVTPGTAVTGTLRWSYFVNGIRTPDPGLGQNEVQAVRGEIYFSFAQSLSGGVYVSDTKAQGNLTNVATTGTTYGVLWSITRSGDVFSLNANPISSELHARVGALTGNWEFDTWSGATVTLH